MKNYNDFFISELANFYRMMADSPNYQKQLLPYWEKVYGKGVSDKVAAKVKREKDSPAR